MTQTKQQLSEKLINHFSQAPADYQTGNQPQQTEEKPITFNPHPHQHQGMQLKRPHTIPAITLTGLSLILLCPISFCAHLFIAHLSHIPTIQYMFMTLLVSFAINYVFIIRKYEVSPFLAEDRLDNHLKVACLLGFVGVLYSLMWGWNGSGGLIFAMMWEKFRGNKMGTFKYLYAIIIVGSVLMEKEYSLMKLVEFIPGILFGISNALIFQLKESSTYTVTHQFIFLTSICLPMFFPMTHIIVPSLLQWGVMFVTGVSMYLTVLCTMKLMQKERVSVVVAVVSGIVTIGTSAYWGMMDFVGAGLVLFGVLFIVKKEFLDLEF